MRNIFRIISKFIERPPELFRRLTPEGIFRLSSDEVPTVYLTFDDGPIPEVTPWVLDLLDSYGVKATFFMVGENVKKYPEVFRSVVDRGHAVGNHTMHHLKGIDSNSNRYLNDVKEASAWIKTRLFRPPHGILRRSQAKKLSREFKIVMYDVVTRDYSKWLVGDDVFANVRRLSRPGSIIVFHDSLKSRRNLEQALPRSIEWLMGKGYRFGIIE